MEWVVKRIDKSGNKSFANNNGWGLLCNDTKTFQEEWYGNHHIKYLKDIDIEAYTYVTVKVPVTKVWTGDIYIFRIGSVEMMAEVAGENNGVITVSGMENFYILTSDIVKVVAERRFLIRNIRIDDDKEELVSYYNSSGYMMVGDIYYSTRYRASEFTKKDLEYVSGNVSGETCAFAVNQYERNYALRAVKDCHPLTSERLDTE